MMISESIRDDARAYYGYVRATLNDDPERLFEPEMAKLLNAS